jgi:hypothetical protein
MEDFIGQCEWPLNRVFERGSRLLEFNLPFELNQFSRRVFELRI